jgi:GDPmannose 4,6-dehydratase/GDP-4-dehydro-6-deoxy-D-mannose reductase
MNRVSRNFKKCLITGITGSLGSYLAEYILKKNKNIKIFGLYRSAGYLNFLKKKYKNRIFFFKIDLNNYAQLEKILKKIKPDLIFHLASNADVRMSFEKPIDCTINNNLITSNLLEALRRLKINPINIVCSTSEVYGSVNTKDLPINENQKIAPINPYAVSKVFQDLLSQVYIKSFGLNIIITRMFSYTNARRDNLFQTSFAKQIAQIENGSLKYLKHGNLNSVRTFVDIQDAVEAYWLTAKKAKIGEVYNIGGEQVISVKNFLKLLIKFSKVKIKCSVDKKLFRPQDINLQIPDASKFKSHTGWYPKVKFEDSVKNLLNECRNIYK